MKPMIEHTDPIEMLGKLYRASKVLVDEGKTTQATEAIGRTYGFAEALHFLGVIKEHHFHEVANKLLLLREKLIRSAQDEVSI